MGAHSKLVTDDSNLPMAWERLEEFRRASALLPQVQEEHARRSYALLQIEAEIAEAERQLHSLESFSLMSVLGSLGGKKQQKIDEVREVLSTLNASFDETTRAVIEIADRVEKLERALGGLKQAEDAFRAACDAKAQAIIQSGGDDAARLAQISDRMADLQSVCRVVRKADETGRQLLRHLESLDRTVRSARGNRRLAGRAGGAVGAVIKNAVASMAPTSATRYVVDGLRRYCEELGALPLGDHPDDADIIRIRAELDAFRERLVTEHCGMMGWDQINTLTAETDVRTAASRLKTMLGDAERELSELEAERLKVLIPGAASSPSSSSVRLEC